MPSPDQQAFIDTYGPLADDIAAATGLHRSVVLGIAAQETGWGKHVSGHNIFGISPTDASGRQYVAGYPDTGQAGQAFVDLVRRRYGDAAKQSDPDAQVTAIVRGGYNSADPNYVPSVTGHARAIRGQAPVASAAKPAAEDPDVAAGRAHVERFTSGKPAPVAAPAANDDPDVAAGRAHVERVASAPDEPASSRPLPADPNILMRAADWMGSGGPSWVERNLPTVHRFAAGATQGARDVVASGADLARWVDDRVPLLRSLDQANPLVGDPAQLAEAMQAQRGAFEQSPAGQSTAGQIGRVGGQIVAASPLLGPVGEVAGAALAPVSAAARAGTNFLASGAPAVIQPVVRGVANAGNYLTRMAGLGGTEGAAFGAATEGGTDRPLGENVRENAALGAVIAPAGGVALKALGAASSAAGKTAAYVTGSGARKAVDEAVGARVEAAGPPVDAPAPGGTAPAESTVGAAWLPPEERYVMEHGERLANWRRNITLGQAERPRPNDATQYVEGSRPTLAEQMADPHLAAVQRQVAPGNATALSLDTANNAARLEHLDNMRGDAPSLRQDRLARGAQADQDLAAAFGAKQDVDPAAVERIANQMTARLQTPRAVENDTLQDTLRPMIARLREGDGFKLDPERLYGVREHINRELQNAARSEDANVRSTAGHLRDMKNMLDEVIESGAQGYRRYLHNYASASRHIDTQELLQNMNWGTADQKITLAGVNRNIDTIKKMLTADGWNAAKGMSDAQLEGLLNLRRDLARENVRTWAAPIGSPTAFNLDLGARLGINAAVTAGRAVANRIPGGNLLIDAAQGRIEGSNAERMKQQWLRHLYGQRPMNPLDTGPGPTPTWGTGPAPP